MNLLQNMIFVWRRSSYHELGKLFLAALKILGGLFIVSIIDALIVILSAKLARFLAMGNVGSSKQRVYSDNDYQLAIEASKELEHILAQNFMANGQGLHEMVSSVGGAIPTTTVRSIRYVATLRNRLIHDQEMRMLPDRRAFIQNFDNALVELNVIINKRRLDAGGAQPFTAPQCVIF